MIYAGLKDWDKVYDHLKAAVEVKMGGLFLNVHPMWEEVRQKATISRAVVKARIILLDLFHSFY